MPNWCMNILEVKIVKKNNEVEKGEEQLQNFIGGFIMKGFENDVPITDGDFTKRTGTWGTKWNPSGINCNYKENVSAELSFDTAWSPPDKWLYKVAEKYDHLEFTLTYEEPNLDFCGKLIVGVDFENLIEASLTDSSRNNIEKLMEIFGKEYIIDSLNEAREIFNEEDFDDPNTEPYNLEDFKSIEDYQTALKKTYK